MNALPWPVYHIDLEGRFGWWNSRVPEVTGYSDDELGGMAVEDLLTEEDGRLVAETLAGATPDSQWCVKFPVVTKDGRRLPYRHEGTVKTDDAGKPVGVTALARACSEDGDDERRVWTYRRLLETLGSVVERLIATNTQADIERTVCEGLTESELYNGVWIGRLGRDGSVTPVTAAGPVTDAVDSLVEEWAGSDAIRPARRTAETGETHVVHDMVSADLPARVREYAVENGIRSGASVPIGEDAAHGVLVAYSPREDGFDATEVNTLERFASVVGFAIGAVQTERLVLSEPVIELEFRLEDGDIPFVRLGQFEGVHGRMEWMTQKPDGTVAEYFTVHGLDPETVVETFEAGENVASCTVVHEGEPELYEARFTRSAAARLLDAGAEARDIEIDAGGVRLVATAPSDTNVRAAVERVRSVYPDATLVAKRTLDSPADRGRPDAWTGDVSLTDRQLDALTRAFEEGYFEWPRDATAEEVAAKLGISAATLHYHLRRAERALAESFLATR